MSSTPKPNPNVPQIPQPQADVGALAFVVQALKQGVDSLAGNRGDPRARAVTFNDLDALELFGAPALNSGAVGVIGAKQLFGNPRTIAAAPLGVTLAAGLSLSLTGVLSPNWQGPGVSTIGGGLTISTDGTMSVLGEGSESIVAGPGLSGGGTLPGTITLGLGSIVAGVLMGNSGTVAAVPGAIAVGAGLTLSNSGTLSMLTDADADIQGTIAATTTATAVSPTGIQSALINMGSVATTINVNSGYVGQHLRLEIKQGATQHAATLGTTVVYGTDIASFTSTPTAGARDVLELINLNGSRWAPAWVSRGFTV